MNYARYTDFNDGFQARFGVPYSVCGCLPPSATKPSASGPGIFSRKGKNKATGEKVISNAHPELVSTGELHAEETHPSEHNAVAIINPPLPTPATRQIAMENQSAAKAQDRRHKTEKRLKEVSKLADKGKLDDWTALQHKRREATGFTHAHTFLCPRSFRHRGSSGEIRVSLLLIRLVARSTR